MQLLVRKLKRKVGIQFFVSHQYLSQIVDQKIITLSHNCQYQTQILEIIHDTYEKRSSVKHWKHDYMCISII